MAAEEVTMTLKRRWRAEFGGVAGASAPRRARVVVRVKVFMGGYNGAKVVDKRGRGLGVE